MAISSNATITGSLTKLQPYEQIFYTSGTWVKPAGVTEVEVTAVGGGAGGYLGYPGSAGGYIKRLVNVTGISSASVLVGNGSSGTNSNAYPGDGGTSSFGSLIYAYGAVGHTARWLNYTQSIGTLESGISEYMQSTSDGISQLRHRETYYVNLAGGVSNPMPGGNSYGTNNKFFWTGSQFVSVSQGSTYIYTSPDAASWTQINSTPVNITNLAYNNTNYVTVQSGIISTTALYSTTLANGSWTYTTLPTNQIWTGIVYGAGVFVAYSSGNTAAAYSTNGGVSWTAMTFPTAAGITMAYLNGYFLGNGVWSTTGTSFTGVTMGVNPTLFSYGNGIWTAGVATVASALTTLYYRTTNPATTWVAGVNPQTLSNNSITVYYSGNPVFISDRFVMTASPNATDYSNNTWMFTSLDAVTWTFVRTKINPYYSVASRYYLQDAVTGPNNRTYALVLGYQTEQSTTAYNQAMVWVFSPYYVGGYNGQSTFLTAGSGYGSTGSYPASPGAGSSPGDSLVQITYQNTGNSTNNTTGLMFGGMGIMSDGFCQGASFDPYYDFQPDNQGTIIKGLPGSGGRGYTSSAGAAGLPWQPGANGIVILKWWQ